MVTSDPVSATPGIETLILLLDKPPSLRGLSWPSVSAQKPQNFLAKHQPRWIQEKLGYRSTLRHQGGSIHMTVISSIGPTVWTSGSTCNSLTVSPMIKMSPGPSGGPGLPAGFSRSLHPQIQQKGLSAVFSVSLPGRVGRSGRVSPFLIVSVVTGGFSVPGCSEIVGKEG